MTEKFNNLPMVYQFGIILIVLLVAGMIAINVTREEKTSDCFRVVSTGEVFCDHSSIEYTYDRP